MMGFLFRHDWVPVQHDWVHMQKKGKSLLWSDVCGQSNARIDSLARYAKCDRGLQASPSMEVAVMCGVAKRDIRSVTGSNIALVRLETGMDPLHSCLGKLKMELQSRVASVPDLDRWRLDYLARLLQQRGEASFIADDAEARRLSTLIDSLCIN